MQPNTPLTSNDAPLELPTKILVVEDDTNVAAVLEARLESFGHKVCAIAKTGPKAIASALEYHPDLVLMDILLEGEMNGIEAAAQINRQMDVPIVYLSCLSDQHIMDQAIKTNPFGYVIKPYNNSELKTTIEIALIKHQAAREREELISKLEKALLEVKKLSGLLPICASCKKIRDKQGSWHSIEAYICSHSEASFSHGICPECLKRLYPELENRKNRTSSKC